MKRRGFVALVVLVAMLLAWTAPILADDPFPESDAELAQRYAPVFYFHSTEVFRPQPVDVIVKQARLRQSRQLWFDVNILLRLDVLDLFDLESDESHFLDIWYGDEGGSAYTNYTAHQAYYEAVLSPDADGPPITVYAHVARDEDRGHVTIQYWALYFYNDWFNKHEGDWEMVQVMLKEDDPEWVVLSQHHGGTRRAWANAPVEDGTHPVAYVAQGSHANYFVGNEIYPNGKDVGNTRIEILDRTGASGRAIPDVILIPDRASLAEEPAAWPGTEWLPFRGHWGQAAPQGDFGGPLGPADKGEQWAHPYTWGMAQPLDTEVWYRNRLRVEVIGAAQDDVQIRLANEHGKVLDFEDLGNLAILHYDLPAEMGIVAEISVPPETYWDVVAAWPDVTAGEVTSLRFADVEFTESGHARLELRPGAAASLIVGDTDQILKADEAETFEATWNAPDLVWIGGVLPAHQVGMGLLIALLAGVVPAMLYVGTLYWADRYEKEPKRLLAAAFVWGAIPSVALSLAMEVFFQLPPNLLGPQALEAVRLGLVAPVLQEALKGAAVLFIARRYRREFDNVLDGIIYGAMVGFGFAMTGNVVSYVSSFALWGFDGLNVTVFAEGIVYGLDHALYTAFFGAALGFARLAQKPWQRWAVPVGGFVLTVATHALHNLILRNLLGLSVTTVVTTCAGLILMGVIAAWSLERQQRCLVTELADEAPDALYRTLTKRGGRSLAQWRALFTGGLEGWRRARSLHQLYAELAFKKMQHRLRPDDPEMAEEIGWLRQEIETLQTT
jgi:protease PrsW